MSASPMATVGVAGRLPSPARIWPMLTLAIDTPPPTSAGAPAGELGRADIDALGIAIGSRVVVEAVDVGVDHARCDPRPRVVPDLAGGLIGLPGAKDAVLDHEIAAQLRACRQEELVNLNCVRAHLCSRTRSVF